MDSGDELGIRFKGLGLDDREKSPLGARNNSVLAHGFRPVGEPVFRQLQAATFELAGLYDADLPAFPRLSG